MVESVTSSHSSELRCGYTHSARPQVLSYLPAFADIQDQDNIIPASSRQE